MSGRERWREIEKKKSEKYLIGVHGAEGWYEYQKVLFFYH